MFCSKLSTVVVRHKPIDSNVLNARFLSSNNNFFIGKRGSFFQEKPKLLNPFKNDELLNQYLKRHLPNELFSKVETDFVKFGDRISNEIHEHGLDCERNPPTLQQFDAWGNRIDEIKTCESWKFMKKISAEEGVISIGYKREYNEFSRLYQMAKLYLFVPSSGLFSCPLAMVDGAAAILESTEETKTSDMLENALNRLTTTNPNEFWTSGQWMTERKGGSDVAGGTETFAHPQKDGSYKLYGYKWFTSATDADVTLTLARIVDKNGYTTEGSKGLSLFFLPIRSDKSELKSGLNGLEVQRLKEKLGTRQLPTSEMLLDGSIAYLLGEKGHGVKNISKMLTLTRIHNSIASVAIMRKILQFAIDYSTKRRAFGTAICNHPLHVKTLAEMEIRARASFVLTFEAVLLLGKMECGIANDDEKQILRLLTPLAKLHTAKEAVAVASEGLECFGGQGYMEDTGLPAMLRDAQVLSIWEGTTNILSLDVLRAIQKSKGEVINSYFRFINRKLENARNISTLQLGVNSVENSLEKIMKFCEVAANEHSDYQILHGRDFAYSLARTYAAALLLDHASWTGANQNDGTTAISWCKSELCLVHADNTDTVNNEINSHRKLLNLKT